MRSGARHGLSGGIRLWAAESRICSRWVFGATPAHRAKALLNDAAESYPTWAAISLIEAWLLASSEQARCIRHSVKYSRGDLPSVSVNRTANAVRDMATSLAREATVHGSSGCWCMRASAGPMAGSTSALSQAMRSVGSGVPWE